jgi:hypothetical protein
MELGIDVRIRAALERKVIAQICGCISRIREMTREGILDHSRLESCLSAGIFLGIFIYLWKGIEPHLLYYGFGVFTAYPIVSWEGPFLRATFSTPGGPIRALAALLAQCYSQAWLGALTIAAVLGVLFLGIQYLLRTREAGRLRDLAWIPVLLALTIYNYYENPLPVLLAVGLSIWTAILYDALPVKTLCGRTGLFLILLGMVYCLAGASVFVFVAITCLTETLRHKKLMLVLTQIALAFGGVVILVWLVFGLGFRAIYTAGTPWDANKPLTFSPLADWFAFVLHIYIPSLILVAFLGGVLWEAEARRNTRRGSRKEGPPFIRTAKPTHWPQRGSRVWVVLRMLLVAVTFILCMMLSRTPLHNERALHYHAQQRDWNRVLALAGRMRGKHLFTRSGIFDINRALAHQGRLGSELCTFPQDDFKTLFMSFDDMSGRLTRAKSLELDLDLGCLNAAEKDAYELLAQEGPSPPLLDALVRIHLAKGQYESARIIFQALRKYVGCRQYVRRWQAILADHAQTETDPLLQSWRRVKPARDDTSIGISPVVLRNLLEDTPGHRLAFEYLMACILLRNEYGELIKRLPLLKPLGYKQLPRHYAEALLVHSLQTGTPVDAYGWTIDPDVQRQFWEIRRIVTDLHGNDQIVFDTLMPKYGDTYMFYSMFRQCGLR